MTRTLMRPATCTYAVWAETIEMTDWHAVNCPTCKSGRTCEFVDAQIAVAEGRLHPEAPWLCGQSRPVPAASKSTPAGTGRRTVVPATERQIGAIRRMLESVDRARATQWQQHLLDSTADALRRGALSKRDASQAIDVLVSLPRAPRPGSGPTEKQIAFFRRLQAERDLPESAEAVFLAAADTRKASALLDGFMMAPKRQLTLAQAKEIGRRTGRCAICHRELTKQESIEAGIGPVCASRF